MCAMLRVLSTARAGAERWLIDFQTEGAGDLCRMGILCSGPGMWSGLLGSLESGRDGLMDVFDWGSAVASEPARGRGRGIGRAGDRPTLERGRRKECWVRRSGAGEPVQEWEWHWQSGSGGRVPRKEATTASEPNAKSKSKSKSPVQRREQVAGDWDRICCTAPRQEEWRCTAKRNQSTNWQAPAPRSGSEDTELMHKRHKDAVCGVNLWPTISLGQVEDAGRWSKYGVNLLTVRRTAKWERSALFAQGKRQRLQEEQPSNADWLAWPRRGCAWAWAAWVGEAAGTQGRETSTSDVKQHGRWKRRRRRWRGDCKLQDTLHRRKHKATASSTPLFTFTTSKFQLHASRLAPRASRLTPLPTPHASSPPPTLHCSSNHTQTLPMAKPPSSARQSAAPALLLVTLQSYICPLCRVLTSQWISRLFLWFVTS
ncbi:hypothetical protein BGZ57DRAFT_861468 [Hyaloscypha finlandica]|nr:hypothetical protein BGZ57DRAFT_861468 [Hyaloscypha finlandica]